MTEMVKLIHLIRGLIMSKRSEEISRYISMNIRNNNVVNDACDVFKFTENEIKASNAIAASLIPIRAMLIIYDSYADIAVAGIEAIESKAVKDRVR